MAPNNNDDPLATSYTELNPTGELWVQLVRGKSVCTVAKATYPLKFILPQSVVRPLNPTCLVYLVGYGGGLVQGDNVGVSCNCLSGTTLVLKTQASTKVYKSMSSLTTRQNLRAVVNENSTLVVIPDPVSCYAKSSYCQNQTFELKTKSSSLILVDWMTGGRKRLASNHHHRSAEIDETWLMQSYESSNVISRDGIPILIDRVILNDSEHFTLKERMDKYHVWGMLVIVLAEDEHSPIRNLVTNPLVKKFQDRQNQELFHNVLTSVSQFSNQKDEDGIILRFASTDTESVYAMLQQILNPVGKTLFGFELYPTNI